MSKKVEVHTTVEKLINFIGLLQNPPIVSVFFTLSECPQGKWGQGCASDCPCLYSCNDITQQCKGKNIGKLRYIDQMNPDPRWVSELSHTSPLGRGPDSS